MNTPRKLLGIFLLGTALNAGAAVVGLPFYDPLNYSDGQLYTVGAGVWDAGGNTGPELAVSNAFALTAPTGLTNATGKGMRWLPSGTARRSMIQFTPPTSGSIYVSFLMNVVSAPGSAKLVAYLDSSTSQPSSPQLGFFVGGGTLGIGKKTSTPGATTSIGSGTQLIVLRYTITGTTTDTVDFWVNPDSSTFGAGSAPAANGSTSGGNNVASIPYFGIYAASGAGPGIYFDEIRLGTNWAQVTPPSSGGDTNNNSSNRIPRFTHSSMNAGKMILRGTNGTAGAGYELICATNLSLPLAQWNVVGSNNFSGTGTFDTTNSPAFSVGANYYRLRVGGSGNGTNGGGGGGNPTAPSITSQPQNQQALIGQSALFSVAATGSAPLSYQWYFNTNTPLAGGTNSTYVVSNVTSNDAGSYRVVVSNGAGSATSSNALLAIADAPTNGNWFVSPSGSDGNPGTFALPFATLPKAISVVQPGQIIYLRGGTYAHSTTIRFTNSGTVGNPIQLLGYPGEWPVFDFSTQPYGAANRGFLIPTNGNWWVFKDFEIHHAGDNGIKVEGSHHRFERLVLHHNGDTGIQIGFGHTDANPGGLLAAFIDVINCDSYLNYDSDSNGGDADGFAAKMHCGQGIVFQGCRAWENSDDAWDLFETDYSIVISNCWAWKSGVGQGNGNGFKLGGDGAGGNSMGTHYAYNCVAFSHKVNCFTQNSHRDGLVVQHCLAFSPGASGYNYFMEGTLNSGKQNTFRNNVSVPRSGTNGGGFIADNSPIEQNNTWNLAVTANSADYISILEAAAKEPRLPDGSLPTGFARLVSGSDLIDKGVNVSLPFNGTAPDLGPFEY